ncbi:unnamed protein product, partial [Effrenium voratum]
KIFSLISLLRTKKRAMGNVLLGAEEEGLRILPFAVVVVAALYLAVKVIFGGCRPFMHELRSELGECCGYPPLAPLEPPEARTVRPPGLVQALLEIFPVPPSAPAARLVPASSAEPAEGRPACPICVANWPNAALDCGHRVCAACLTEIQSRSNLCPVCRYPIRQAIRLYN